MCWEPNFEYYFITKLFTTQTRPRRCDDHNVQIQSDSLIKLDAWTLFSKIMSQMLDNPLNQLYATR